MKPLLFATNNPHKVSEMQTAIGDRLRVISLREAGIDVDIPEPYDTIPENALGKARKIHEMTGLNCFAEDTGLETEALAGAPGVHSARYAGPQRDDRANAALLLRNLEGRENRRARFRTVIALHFEGREFLFEGICAGTIAPAPRGEGGFGYDPVFVPDDFEKTFAEMSAGEKNAISHRRRAAEQLIAFLQAGQP